jgi:hypothetical protein
MSFEFDKKIKLFEENCTQARATTPLRIIQNEPKIPQITKDTKRFLKFKSLIYILKEDHKKITQRYIFKRPFFYGFNFLKSLLKKESFKRDGDSFLYGCDDLYDWYEKLKDPEALLVVGFSYCHKPLECPSGRFTSACINQAQNPVCAQCLIHKYKQVSVLPGTLVFVIPTIHYIGEKILKVKNNYKDKKILFLISACEMTLNMFGDWGNMAKIEGVGIRLGGRICNTMQAFILSEQGIKPGLTTISKQADEVIVKSLKIWSEHGNCRKI